MSAEYGNGMDRPGDTGHTWHGAGHPAVDLDLLADYAGGALEGAADEVVAARVATDPAWASAYRQLREADTAVRGDLAALGTGTPAMPADIGAQLDAALAAAADTAPPASPVSPAAAPPAPISLAARRRRMRVAAVAAVAATVVAIAGVTVGVVTSQSASDQQSATSQPSVAREDNGAAEAPRQAPSSTAAPGAKSGQDEAAPNPVIRHSGRNYTADTVRQVLASPSPSRARTPRAMPAPLPRELTRLDKQNERVRCLEAVRERHGAYPTLVDYGRYEGDPALIMVLPPRKAGSRPSILVVGPNCGISGTDQRYFQN